MRKLLLATAALVGLGLAPAFADNSITQIVQTGTNGTATQDVSGGSNNQAYINQAGNLNSASQTQVGSGNYFNSAQTGTGNTFTAPRRAPATTARRTRTTTTAPLRS